VILWASRPHIWHKYMFWKYLSIESINYNQMTLNLTFDLLNKKHLTLTITFELLDIWLSYLACCLMWALVLCFTNTPLWKWSELLPWCKVKKIDLYHPIGEQTDPDETGEAAEAVSSGSILSAYCFHTCIHNFKLFSFWKYFLIFWR